MKTTKLNFSRSLVCIIACCMILFFSFLPVRAATSGLSGVYTMNDNLSLPAGWTDQEVYFLSGDVYYTAVHYEALNEAYGVPVLWFGDTRVYLFGSGDNSGRWLPNASNVVDFGSLAQQVDNYFYDWLLLNAQVGVVDPDYEAAGDIKTEVDGIIAELGGVSDAYEQLPKPNVSVPELIPDQIVGDAYIHLSGIISRFWDNPLLLVYSSVLGGLMVISYVLFASK